MDLDFGNIREYPPEHYHGLIVLRAVDQSRRHVRSMIDRVVTVLDRAPLEGRLWVVSEAGIRIRPGQTMDEPS